MEDKNHFLIRKEDFSLIKADMAILLMNKVLDPLAAAYFNTGFEKYESRQYELAIIDFNTAIDISPLFKEAYNFRGNCKDYVDNQELFKIRITFE